MAPSPSPLRRDIQGLRALAVLAVVGAHAAGWPRAGVLGVDVFFVLSGFLITGMLLRELRDRDGISLRAFYARRARRLLPAALVTLVVVAGTSALVLNAVRAEATLTDAAWAAVFAANWRFAAQGTDYFAAGDAVSPLQHFWSLAVEEQFTLVWPGAVLLLALALPSRSRRGGAAAVAVGSVALVLAAASYAWALAQTAEAPAAAYFSTLTRVWELAAGAVLAALVPVLRRIPRPLGIALSWAGLAGIVASLVTGDPASGGMPAPGAAGVVLATCAALAGGVGGDPRHRHLIPLTNPVAVFVGNLSYSLYLWHFPVVVIGGVVYPDAPVAVVLAAVAVLTLASYFIVEQPLRYAPFLGGRMPGTRVDVPSVAEEQPAAVTPPAPLAATRPAGWTPGARYYPGSTRPAPRPAPAPPPPPPALTPAPAPRERPATWPERFGAQMALASAGLVVAVLAGALWSGSAGDGPRISLPVFAAPSPEAPGDAVAALQAELGAAAAASAWPDLTPSLEKVMSASSAANPARDCFSPGVTISAASCSWGSGDAPVHVYLVGDSTAMAYAPTFRRIAEDSGGGIRVTTVGMYGCRFTDVLIENDDPRVMAGCPGRKAEVRALIAADQPDLVVMSNAYTLGRTASGASLAADALIAAQRAEAAAYGMAGRVVHLAPPPQGVSLAACYTPSSSPQACLGGVDTTWRAMETASESAGGDAAVSSLPFTCWQDACPAFAGGVPTKYDQTHLTVEYAERIAPAVAQALAGTGLLTPR